MQIWTDGSMDMKIPESAFAVKGEAQTTNKRADFEAIRTAMRTIRETIESTISQRQQWAKKMNNPTKEQHKDQWRVAWCRMRGKTAGTYRITWIKIVKGTPQMPTTPERTGRTRQRRGVASSLGVTSRKVKNLGIPKIQETNEDELTDSETPEFHCEESTFSKTQ